MATGISRITIRRLPIWTLGMITTGFIVYAFPDLASQIVYNRSAILSGEVWRLITGHWVHFSISHLLYNLTTLGIVGSIIERQDDRHYKYLYILSPFLIGASLLVIQPEIHFYGGLSGVVCGATVYLALHGLKEAGAWRWICLAVLLLTIAKVVIESLTGQFATVASDSTPFVPVPLSHLVGGLTGLFIFGWTHVIAAYNNS